MKKTVFFALLMLISTAGSYAQVTVGNDTPPAATLDVVNTDGSTPAGIIAPRLTLTQLAAADDKYLPAQTGAIVYVTNASGTTTTKTAKVTVVGYYYFDGSVWQLVNGGTEWYTAGTANDAQADKTGSITRNGRVAIYSGSNPPAAVTPGSALNIINETTIDANDNISINTHSESKNVTPSLILYNAQGTREEPLPLDKGRYMGSLQFGSTPGILAAVVSRYEGDGTTSESSMSFVTNGAPIGNDNVKMHIGSNGNVGIGDLSPASKLEVNGAITNTASFNAGTSTTTIDFSRSNFAYSGATSGTITLQNIKDGGVYYFLTNVFTTSSLRIIASGFKTYKSDHSGTSNSLRLYTIKAIGINIFVSVDSYNTQP